MSSPFQKPTILAGTPGTSGDLGTKEQRITDGGERRAMYLSGVAVDTLAFSGAGRLDRTFVITNLVSGRPVTFYDGHVATSGGPFSASGHVVIGVIGPVWHPGGSGIVNDFSQPGSPVNWQTPFFSGLIVAPGPAGSGTCGFGFSYTPDPTGIASGATIT